MKTSLLFQKDDTSILIVSLEKQSRFSLMKSSM